MLEILLNYSHREKVKWFQMELKKLKLKLYETILSSEKIMEKQTLKENNDLNWFEKSLQLFYLS